MSVTKHGYLNILIGLLIAASILLLFQPSITIEEETVSIGNYVCLPQDYTALNDALEEAYPNYSLNATCWSIVILAIFQLLSLMLLIILHNRTFSLICPMMYSVYGIILSLSNVLFKVSAIPILFAALLLGILVLCLFNGIWRNTASTWGKDAHAKTKLAAIAKAESKKKIDTLALYANSMDVEVRTAAITALGRTGSKEAFQPIVIQMNCPNADIRIAAAHALGELGDGRGRSFLLHFIKTDSDQRVQNAMRNALTQIPVSII